MARLASARACGSVAKARLSPRNMLRGNWLSRISSASAPSALISHDANRPSAAASCSARKRRRISSSSAGFFSNQPFGPTLRQNDTTSAGLDAVSFMGELGSRRRRPDRLVAQRAAQNLADIGLGQVVAKFDLLGHLVAGE